MEVKRVEVPEGRIGFGNCTCFSDLMRGYWGTGTCTDCQIDAWGPSCRSRCPACRRGYCASGRNGTGLCMCPPGTWGPLCATDCPGGAGNPCNGHGKCSGLRRTGGCQ